jgi:PhnB protein
MQMNPYLNFKGDCEAAFAFYQRVLKAQLGPVFRYGGSPMAGQVPSDWANKIMHGSITVAGQVIMGADVIDDRYETPQGISLSLQIETPAEAEKVFHELASGGKVVLPIAQTFWAQRFGMLVDRFGIPWMINCEAPKPA